jgi:hypothetical protein
LTAERRKQLEMEQRLIGGQALTSLLDSLFAASAAAAGDAELAALYTHAMGEIRIAQLRQEADALAALSYLTDAAMAAKARR